MNEDETVSPPDESQDFRWLIAEWSGALSKAIEGMGSPLPVAEVVGTGIAPKDDGSFWWAQQFSLLPESAVWIGAGESFWKQIGTQALQAIGFDAPEPSDVRDTYREILVQSLSGLAARLTARCGQEVTCPHGEPLSGPPYNGMRGFVGVRAGDSAPVELCFMASKELIQRLRRQNTPEASSPVQTAREAPGSSEPAATGVAVALESVLDVEMPISVSFGTARLCLEEALRLTEGSVVRLGRADSEFVDLQVNGRVVARGEIVAVRGQYGIRIRELSRHDQRLSQIESLQRPQRPDPVAS
jgi:flagellar motor switch protein FliN/FliY